MVCRGKCPDEFWKTAQQSRDCLPHVSSATARLRAFSYGYRVHPHHYRSEFTKTREVGWCSPIVLTRRHVGGLRVNDFTLARDDGFTTTSTTGEEKAPRRNALGKREKG